jgi:hypothetical protein
MTEVRSDALQNDVPQERSTNAAVAA